jgi:hypothetical protein
MRALPPFLALLRCACSPSDEIDPDPGGTGKADDPLCVDHGTYVLGEPAGGTFTARFHDPRC